MLEMALTRPGIEKLFGFDSIVTWTIRSCCQYIQLVVAPP
jgi:hypothetical protein